jgi:hypothetical protein
MQDRRRTIEAVLPFTNASVERIVALVNAVTYITKSRISGCRPSR